MNFTALVTGSSRGMGYSIAEKLLEESATVIGTSTKAESPINHERYTHIQVDLSNPEDIEAKLKPVFEGKEVPEVVINNAGIFEDADFEINQDDWLTTWDRTQQVNLRAPAIICKWAVNAWRKAGIDGRIINNASRAAYRGDTQEYASYAASKGGLVAFTKSMARSLGQYGITTYSISPGFVNTDMARESIEVYGADYLTKDLALNEIAPPEQIAEMVYLLASGKLTHATGQNFHINSGSYIL